MLSKRWLINYGLILLIVLFTWIGNRYQVQTGYQPEQSAARRIADARPADIERIDIATADANLALARGAGGWSLTAPVSWPADNGNVEHLLNLLNSETDSRLPAAEIELAALGLERPRALLRLNDLSIRFGDTNNIGERRYLLIGDVVFLLPDNHLPFLAQGLPGLADRRLLPGRLRPVRLELPDFHLSRDGDGWRQTRGAARDPGLVDELAANWTGLPAGRVEVYRDGPTPRQKIRAALADGREIEFFVMSIDPEIVIANPAIGLQYRFRSDYYYRLITVRKDEPAA